MPSLLLAQLGTAASTVRGTVRLRTQPDIRRGIVAAFPRVLPGAGVSAAAAAKINALLAEQDDEARQSWQDCRDQLRGSKRKADPNAYTRTVSVTMQGPRYLGLQADEDFECGGAHPSQDLVPITFDLKTGDRVNWSTLLPHSAKLVADDATGSMITWPMLITLGKQQADSDCKDAWDGADETFFYVQMQASSASLVFTPDFPHVMQACADGIALDSAALRREKVSPEVIAALQAAYALQQSSATVGKGAR